MHKAKKIVRHVTHNTTNPFGHPSLSADYIPTIKINDRTSAAAAQKINRMMGTVYTSVVPLMPGMSCKYPISCGASDVPGGKGRRTKKT